MSSVISMSGYCHCHWLSHNLYKYRAGILRRLAITDIPFLQIVV